MTIKCSGIEREVIVLKAVNELIDAMINLEVISLSGRDPHSEVTFESPTHQRFFNIVLVDFLSRTDKEGPINTTSFIGGLTEIANNPYFDDNNSIENLEVAVNEFKDWLLQEVEVDVWLPSIDGDTKLDISRIRFLKMTGNISKHSYLRTVGVASDLRDVLLKSGISIDVEEALLALAEFHERFQGILNYHASTVAEFLNNIRWGIYDYLQPELNKSIVIEGGHPTKYHYTYPKHVQNEFAKACYWDLMNEARSKPYIRRFEVTKWLKLQY